jgi:non-specific serine/threonine protein kinase
LNCSFYSTAFFRKIVLLRAKYHGKVPGGWSGKKEQKVILMSLSAHLYPKKAWAQKRTAGVKKGRLSELPSLRPGAVSSAVFLSLGTKTLGFDLSGRYAGAARLRRKREPVNMELRLTPQGLLESLAPQDLVGGELKEYQELSQIFGLSRAEVLLRLCDYPHLRTKSVTLSYWFDIAHHMMRQICSFAELDPFAPALSPGQVRSWVEAAPPMDGEEHLDEDLLLGLFADIVNYLRERCGESGLTPREYLARYFPAWAHVGRIHFHLAESAKDPERPFAFLATYTVRVPDKTRLQHRPLALAISDSLKGGEKELSRSLLMPLRAVAAQHPFIKQLVDEKHVFRPHSFTPQETYHFMRAIPLLEDAGIVCKVPEKWQAGGAPRVKVTMSVGGASQPQSKAGFGGMLDFRVGLALGDEMLTPEEIKAILNGEGGLVQIRGKWVEVDRERLGRIMEQWRRAMGLASQKGVSFADAMRMVAGFGRPLPTEKGASSEEDAGFCQVVADTGMKKLLADFAAGSEVSHKEYQAAWRQHLKAQLRPYQEQGVGWLAHLAHLGLGGVLADDMGLGKTVQVIALLVGLKFAAPAAAAAAKRPASLLIVPASLLGNWLAETRKFAPQLRCHVQHPSMTGSFGIPEDCDLIMTSYGMLLNRPEFFSVNWHLVIADEAQALRNSGTRQSQAVRSLKAHARFALTGTPIENRMQDLWSIYDFACPGLLGREEDFSQELERLAASKSGYAPLKTLIAPYLLRRRKSDKSVIADLPDKIERQVWCRLTPVQVQLYQKQVDSLKKQLEECDEKRKQGLVLTALLRFKQICNHPSQALADDNYDPRLSGKFEKLQQLARQIARQGQKLLVFTQFRELTDILAHLLSEIYGRRGLVLHGGVAPRERTELVSQFQKADGPPFFILSLKAGGAGLNLTQASHVIHFDRWWNPAVENQATDRAYRIGQKINVMVHKFVCRGTIEDKIDRILRDKRDVADQLIDDQHRSLLQGLSPDELMKLVTLDLTTLTTQEEELEDV